MKKITALVATILFLTAAAPALAAGGAVYVDVNGLVCDFCARALEKVFGKQEAVEKIDVNLDTKVITINFKDGKSLDDKAITGLINDAGYNVVAIRHEEGKGGRKDE